MIVHLKQSSTGVPHSLLISHYKTVEKESKEKHTLLPSSTRYRSD